MRSNTDLLDLLISVFNRIEKDFPLRASDDLFSEKKKKDRTNRIAFLDRFFYLGHTHIRIILGTVYICNSYCISCVAVSKDCFYTNPFND